MPVAPEDRPLAAVREATIDRLIVNYGHGELSLEAFERRLDQALEATSAAQLLALTADLDLDTDNAYADTKRAELTSRPAPRNVRDVEHMINIFGGSNRSGAWLVPREIRMLNLFGGGELDFSQARFGAGTTRVKMLCLFGGASFYVSENINTVSKAVCIFGGIDNRAASHNAPSAPTLLIEGLCIFGGASITLRKTLRERWMALAEHVKTAFGPLHHRY